jgi:CsoR family transcriptional regulator, copper-sensing transcriptional repressor
LASTVPPCYNRHMKHAHNPEERTALIVRLRKIRGQLQAIEKMVETETDCAEVLAQVVSARRALKSFGDTLIQSHLHDCIEHAETQAESRKNLRAFLTVLERYVA